MRNYNYLPMYFPVDYWYRSRHGMFPDLHFLFLLERGHTVEEASRIRQASIGEYYEKWFAARAAEKGKQEKYDRIDGDPAYGFTDVIPDDCPFV